MVSLFYARHYPAGREVNSDDQPVPNDTQVLDVNVPSSTFVNDSQSNDVPPADGVPASSDVPNLTQTPTDVLSTTTTPSPDVPVVTYFLDPSPQPSELPRTTITTPVQDPPTPESTTVPDQNPTGRNQHLPWSSAPTPNPNPSPNPGAQKRDPAPQSPEPTQTDYFVPSSALNYLQPTNEEPPGTDDTPASSSTIVSTHNLPASSTVTLSTGTLQPTPTAVLTQGGALSKGSSSNKKYIIGGAVGGGVLVVILFVLLLICCRKRRAKKDLERSGGGHSEGQPGYGQFACCNNGACNRNNVQPQMEQKTPLRPFMLKSGSATLTPTNGRQHHTVSLNRKHSTETQKSAGSDTLCSSDSEGSQRGRRRSQKRPPPLKLTSLVTPVINGPQNNPRGMADRSSLPIPHEVPMITVEPPQSATRDRMRRR